MLWGVASFFWILSTWTCFHILDSYTHSLTFESNCATTHQWKNLYDKICGNKTEWRQFHLHLHLSSHSITRTCKLHMCRREQDQFFHSHKRTHKLFVQQSRSTHQIWTNHINKRIFTCVSGKNAASCAKSSHRRINWFLISFGWIDKGEANLSVYLAEWVHIHICVCIV